MERHTNLSELLSVYHLVKDAFKLMSGTEYDGKTISDAQSLLMYLEKAEFICAFVIAEHMLGYTKYLSIKLQG